MTRPDHHKSDEEQFQELDVLVLAEMETLCPRPPQPRPGRATATAEGRPLGRSSPARRPVAPERRPRDDAGPSGEEFDGLFEGTPTGEPIGPDADDDRSTGSLLTPEEDAFIARAVGFLSQREHADMILGRIWEQLTELDPEAFYQAPAAAEPAQGTKDAAGTSEGPSPDEDTPEGTAS